MQHPLYKFRFCPVCGSKHFDVNNFKSKKCRDCGFTYYANACSATAAFIINSKDELLVVRRGKEPARGTLDLPGGFVDMDETAEEGMIREIEEETGLRLEHPEYMFSIPNRYEYSGMIIHTLDMFYRCGVDNDVNPQAADDAQECMWIPLKDVDYRDFGLTSISQAVKRAVPEFSKF